MFKAKGTTVIDSGAGCTPAWPTHHAGDYALLVTQRWISGGTGAESLTTANGFALVGAIDTTTTAGIHVTQTVWWCFATSSSMASPVVANSGSGHTAVIYTFSGRANAAPDFAQSTNLIGNSFTVAGGTPSVPNDGVALLVFRLTNAGSESLSGWTNANITNLVEYDDESVTVGGNVFGIGLAGGVLRPNSALGNTTASWSSTDTFPDGCGFAIGLKPLATTTVSRDATSGKWRPGSDSEYSSLFYRTGLCNPTVLHLMQEPSGNFADSIGNRPLNNPGGGGIVPSTTVTGETAKGCKLQDGTVAMLTDGSNPNDSTLVFDWTWFPAVSSGTIRSVQTIGGGFGTQVAFNLQPSSSPLHIRNDQHGGLGQGGTTVIGTGDLHSSVRPCITLYDATNALSICQTDQETTSQAAAGISAGANRIGGDNSSTWFAGDTVHLFNAVWNGRAAELGATMRAILLDRHINGPAVASIANSPSSATIGTLGGTQAVTATATRWDSSTFGITAIATWSSDNPSVATVNASGVVTAVASGTAHITCTYQSLGDVVVTSTTTTITVSAATYSAISITPAVGSCVIGGTKQFTAIATLTLGGTQDVTSTAVWSSSNPAAATVAAGLATGVSIGGTNITATIGGHSDTSLLTVLVNAGVAGDLTDQQSALFGEDIWYDVSHPDNTGYADLIVDAGGDWQDVTGIEALRQSLLRRLITNPGEWQTVPDYGVGARQYIKAPMTPSTLSELEARIRSQYLRDDRVEAIDSITITPLTGDQPGICVLVNVIPKGRLRQDASLPVAITIT